MAWRFLRGREQSSAVKIGVSAVSAGELVKFVNGLVVAAGDGDEAHGVMHEDGAASATKVIMDHLVPGSVWEAPVSSQTLKRGTRVAIAANGLVDAGTSGDWSPGYIVDYDLTTGDTVAHIYIDPGTIA